MKNAKKCHFWSMRITFFPQGGQLGAVAFSNKATISVTFLQKSSWVVFCLGSGHLEANSPSLLQYKTVWVHLGMAISFKIVCKSLVSRHAYGDHGLMETYELSLHVLLSIIFLVAST